MTIVCNCPARCEIHPNPKIEVVRPGILQKQIPPSPAITDGLINAVPSLDAADKLTLKTLEAEWLKTRYNNEMLRQQALKREQDSYSQLEQFSAAMYDKAGIKQSEWLLDLTKLEFTRRDSAKG